MLTADHKKLLDAMIAGVPEEQVKDRVIEMDGRRKELERLLSTAPARMRSASTRAWRRPAGAESTS